MSVFVPEDKAANNNVVVVGRKYYMKVLKNEILNSTFQAMLMVFKSISRHVKNSKSKTNKLRAFDETFETDGEFFSL